MPPFKRRLAGARIHISTPTMQRLRRPERTTNCSGEWKVYELAKNGVKGQERTSSCIYLYLGSQPFSGRIFPCMIPCFKQKQFLYFLSYDTEIVELRPENVYFRSRELLAVLPKAIA